MKLSCVEERGRVLKLEGSEELSEVFFHFEMGGISHINVLKENLWVHKKERGKQQAQKPLISERQWNSVCK